MIPRRFLLLLVSSSCLMGQRIDIARTLLTLPDETINFGDFTVIDANGNGNFLFVNQTITPGVPSSENEFLFLSDATGNLTRAITEGQSAPVGLGTLGTLRFTGELAPILGKNGTVAITNILQGTPNPRIVLAWDADSGLREIAREGLPYPDGSSDEFEDFLRPVSVSETNKVTLTAMRDEEIIFQELSNLTLNTIRPFEISGGDILRQNRFVDATNSGQIVLGALYRLSSFSPLTTGIFDILNDDTLIGRALQGDAAPAPNDAGTASDGVFASVQTNFQLNAQRAIVFFATVSEEVNFGDGVFFQQSSSTPTQAVIRMDETLTGGALGTREATFVGVGSGIFPDTTFLLADDQTVYVSGPLLIETEANSRSALIRWTPNSSPEVILIGEEILPDANPIVTLEEISLEDVSANGAVALQASASNRVTYPYHYHPETGLTLLANFDETHPNGTITEPVSLGPQLDDNGDAIFSFLVTDNQVNQRVLSLFDAGITPSLILPNLPIPCIAATATSSTVTISEVPNNISLQLQILDQSSNQFVNFGSPVLSENSAATLPGPNPTTNPLALLRVIVSD